MAEKIVIGLFQAAGIAEDACNRLKHEGVPAADIARVVMRETTERPPQMDSEIEALSVDPLLLGNVRESYAPVIHNGDTAVFVRAGTEADIELAANTLRQYSPTRINVATRRELDAAIAAAEAPPATICEIEVIVY